MIKLFLLRHLKSQWNTEFRFTGWTDVPLDKNELEKTGMLAEKIFQHKIDKIYSSSLFRNQDTVARTLQCINKYPIFVHLDPGKMKNWGGYADKENNEGVPIYTTEKLNERYYGKLQGINKEEAMKEYGEEKVHLWRRSYDVSPPGGESLKAVCNRTMPFYKKYAETDLGFIIENNGLLSNTNFILAYLYSSLFSGDISFNTFKSGMRTLKSKSSFSSPFALSLLIPKEASSISLL